MTSQPMAPQRSQPSSALLPAAIQQAATTGMASARLSMRQTPAVQAPTQGRDAQQKTANAWESSAKSMNAETPDQPEIVATIQQSVSALLEPLGAQISELTAIQNRAESALKSRLDH